MGRLVRFVSLYLVHVFVCDAARSASLSQVEPPRTTEEPILPRPPLHAAHDNSLLRYFPPACARRSPGTRGGATSAGSSRMGGPPQSTSAGSPALRYGYALAPTAVHAAAALSELVRCVPRTSHHLAASPGALEQLCMEVLYLSGSLRDTGGQLAGPDITPLTQLTSALAQLVARGVRPALLPPPPSTEPSTIITGAGGPAGPAGPPAVLSRTWPQLVPGPPGDAVRLLAQVPGIIGLLCEVMGSMDVVLDRQGMSGGTPSRTSEHSPHTSSGRPRTVHGLGHNSGQGHASSPRAGGAGTGAGAESRVGAGGASNGSTKKEPVDAAAFVEQVHIIRLNVMVSCLGLPVPHLTVLLE